MQAKPRIGFIGLGVMGAPMAGHLAGAGYAVTVFDASLEALARVKRAHPAVHGADSPGALGRHADIVVTMLPHGRVVQQVVFGPQGLAEGLAAGALLIDASSAEPALTRDTAARLAPRGIALVDAPVSGAQWGAEAAELVFMVGGEPADVGRARPVLDAMGREVHHVGPVGAGHTMKCINNTITAATFLATVEGLALGARSGLDPAAMNAILNESTGGSWITRNHIEQRILSRSFDDPFRLALMLKDIGIATGVAAETGTPAPIAALTREFYRAADLAAGAGASVSEIARFVERLSGAEIAPRPPSR